MPHEIVLNPVLLRQQNISPEKHLMLLATHKSRREVINLMTVLDPAWGRPALQTAVKVLVKFDYMLQLLWGFPLDPNFHRFWEVPHCTCPKAENEHLWGTVLHLYALDCPVHTDN